MAEEMLTLAEVAKVFGVGEAVVRRMVDRNELPYLRVGRLYRVRRSALVRWMERQEQATVARRTPPRVFVTRS